MGGKVGAFDEGDAAEDQKVRGGGTICGRWTWTLLNEGDVVDTSGVASTPSPCGMAPMVGTGERCEIGRGRENRRRSSANSETIYTASWLGWVLEGETVGSTRQGSSIAKDGMSTWRMSRWR
jgi:hypothetical protein